LIGRLNQGEAREYCAELYFGMATSTHNLEITHNEPPMRTVTLEVPNLRIPVMPNSENSLRKPSEIMVDMIQTSSLSRFAKTIGTIDPDTLRLAEVP
jgi:hypothetical protein